jgi:hypothetical protein
MANRYFRNTSRDSPRHQIYHFYKQPNGPVFSTAPNMFYMDAELKRLAPSRGRLDRIPDYGRIKNRLIKLVGSGPRARTLVNNAYINRRNHLARNSHTQASGRTHTQQLKFYTILRNALHGEPRVTIGPALRHRINRQLYEDLVTRRTNVTRRRGRRNTAPAVINRIFQRQNAILRPPAPSPRKRLAGVRSAPSRTRTPRSGRVRSASSSVKWVHRAPPGFKSNTRTPPGTFRFNHRAPSFVPSSR